LEELDREWVAQLCHRHGIEVVRSNPSPSGRTGILLSKSELWNQSEKQVLTLQGTTLFDVT
jgi:hypothetical protein